MAVDDVFDMVKAYIVAREAQTELFRQKNLEGVKAANKKEEKYIPVGCEEKAEIIEIAITKIVNAIGQGKAMPSIEHYQKMAPELFTAAAINKYKAKAQHVGNTKVIDSLALLEVQNVVFDYKAGRKGEKQVENAAAAIIQRISEGLSVTFDEIEKNKKETPELFTKEKMQRYMDAACQHKNKDAMKAFADHGVRIKEELIDLSLMAEIEAKRSVFTKSKLAITGGGDFLTRKESKAVANYHKSNKSLTIQKALEGAEDKTYAGRFKKFVKKGKEALSRGR